MDSIIYGPVPSWRLGRSFGIDVVSTEGKTCSFDCVYCQLGRTVHHSRKREEFISLEQLAVELEGAKGVEADYITFSGMAEPTLGANLGGAIDIARSIRDLPVAVLTNSSMMLMDEVRQDLARADVVVAKLDAADETAFRAVNRPVADISFEQIVDGIKKLRREFSGTLALQMMFVKSNREQASAMAALAEEIEPDELQLNTPLRPCAVKPLSRDEMLDIKAAFANFGDRVVMVYDVPKPMVTPMNMEETLRRRPQL